jgi:hypothetical protein
MRGELGEEGYGTKMGKREQGVRYIVEGEGGQDGEHPRQKKPPRQASLPVST